MDKVGTGIIQLLYLCMTTNVTKLLRKAVFDTGRQAEICGLLGGFFREPGVAVATAARPLLNLSLRKGSFAVDVEEFCRERESIQKARLVPLILYHSHPDGSTRPSFRDRKLPWITDLPLLILAWDEGKLRFACYGDVGGKMVPISVVPYYDLEANRKPSHE